MATDSKRPRGVKIVTPVGTAVYPKINEPDTKFNALGTYSCKLRLSAEDSGPLINQLDEMVNTFLESEKAELMKGDGKAKAKAKALKKTSAPYKAAVNDDGDETGEYEFNFKMAARVVKEGKPERVMKPDVFDAKGKKLSPAPAIWGGSLLSVAGEATPFNTAIGVGISLRMNAVQIIELRTGGAQDAAGYGFGAQEGYEAPEEEAASTFPAAAGSDDSTDF